MGRHRRNSPQTAATPRGHRDRRRRGAVARTGLLGASAAVAVGAAAVVTGVLPAPSGFSGGGFPLGDGGPGNPARADGTPTALATDGGATVPYATGDGAGPAAPSTSPTRTAARPSARVTPRPAATRTAAPRATVRVSATGLETAATASESSAAAEVLTLVNQERAQAGCRPLTLSSKLTELSQDFSEEMAARGFFDHTDPDGKTPWDRADALGIGNLGGENIAEGQPTARSVMDAWMNSPGHRANILDCDYHSIGIGVHYATGSQSGGPWWTQDFGF